GNHKDTARGIECGVIGSRKVNRPRLDQTRPVAKEIVEREPCFGRNDQFVRFRLGQEGLTGGFPHGLERERAVSQVSRTKQMKVRSLWKQEAGAVVGECHKVSLS